MSKISAKSDASSHQNQTQDSLQRDPGEIEQRPHAVAIQLHKGILEREIMRKRISELQLLFFGGNGEKEATSLVSGVTEQSCWHKKTTQTY